MGLLGVALAVLHGHRTDGLSGARPIGYRLDAAILPLRGGSPSLPWLLRVRRPFGVEPPVAFCFLSFFQFGALSLN